MTDMHYDAEHVTGPASTTGGGPARVRYVVGSEQPELLRSVASRLAAGDEGSVLRWLGTSALVVETTEEVAGRLRTEYPGLLVEVDREMPTPGTVLPPGF